MRVSATKTLAYSAKQSVIGRLYTNLSCTEIDPNRFSLMLKKAKLRNYSHFLWPAHLVFDKQWQDCVNQLARVGVHSVIEIDLQIFTDREISYLLQIVQGNEFVSAEFVGWTPQAFRRLKKIQPHDRIKFCLAFANGFDFVREWQFLPKAWQNNSWVCAPFANAIQNGPSLPRRMFLNWQHVYNEISDWQSVNPSCQLPIRHDRELFDPQIPDELDLEPIPIKQNVWGRQSEKPKLSVVIPTYSNVTHLLTVLSHLQNQQGLTDFEVIVVNDGSPDQTEKCVQQFGDSQFLKYHLVYIALDRKKPRTMGDNRYRAGISRNVGASVARGEILLFLDNDILIPNDYLQTLVQLHKTYDLIQARRYQLKPESSKPFQTYGSIEHVRDTWVPEGAYWETFQEQTADWKSVRASWKYVSTFCLSLRRDVFDRAGHFRKVFTTYGFEDTDLGLKVLAQGGTIFLHPARVYHLYHGDFRSEYSNNRNQKKILLQRSAETLFRHHLRPDIADELWSLFPKDKSELIDGEWFAAENSCHV